MSELFIFNNLSLLMMLLIGFLATVITYFASNYMRLDRNKNRFMINIYGLIISLFIFVTADNIYLFLLSLLISNSFLVKLMIHKNNWQAAYNSGMLAYKSLFIGFISLSLGLSILYNISYSISVSHLVTYNYEMNLQYYLALLLIFFAALCQSAIWPMHKWLLSSLNSPTPSSAFMHAGLVNGGGFILAKFANLYYKTPDMLLIIFIFGAISVILGTFWKLIQNDIKRMLACSTLAQMGFMIMQCGLGLFSAAIAHLCWHGIFKAYLFLASSGASQERRLKPLYEINIITLILSLICGICASYNFALAQNNLWISNNTNLFLHIITLIAGTQISWSIISFHKFTRFPIMLLVASILGRLYGWNIYIIDQLLLPLNISQEQNISAIHIVVLIIFIILWLLNVILNSVNNNKFKEIFSMIYIWGLNTSQPHKGTITAYRNYYKY